MRKLSCIVLVLTIALFGACKKDLLHLHSVQKLSGAADGDRLNKVLFINDSIGFIAGGQRFADAVILSTRDGGHTWQRQTFPAAGKGMYDITLSTNGVLYACGFDGKILRSYDTGRTWLFSQIEYFAFTGIAATDPGHFIAVGGVSFSSGVREYADSNGNVTRRDSFAYQFNKIQMVSPTVGYICGYGIAQKTTDGGNTWSFLNVLNDNFTCMDIHGDELWMCGYNGGIYHTSNGGYNWERLRNGNDFTVPAYHLQSIAFRDSRHGWAAGEGGKLIYTDDGGHHWAEYDQFTGSNLFCVTITPAGDLLVTGDKGAIYRITP